MQIRIADTRREHRAAQRPGAMVKNEPSRRQVIGESVDDNIAGAKARSMERASAIPWIIARCLGLPYRARRHENAFDPLEATGQKSTEGRLGLLLFEQLGLAKNRQSRKRLAAGDRGEVMP